jgi:hypothetical protein
MLGDSFPPKPEGYNVQIFHDELPQRPFSKISRLDVHLEKTHLIGSSFLNETLPELEKQARLSGADAIIEIRGINSSVGETKIFHVSAIGIRYTDNQKNGDSTEITPSLQTPSPAPATPSSHTKDVIAEKDSAISNSPASSSKKSLTQSLQPAKFGKFVALLIGNDRYQHISSLKTAINDVEMLKTTLENKYGFQTTIIRDATRRDILSAITNIQKQITADTNLLIYYAGHGHLADDENRGYWLPVDAEEDNSANWIANDDITSKVKTMTAKHVLVIADSCYSGMLSRSLLSGSHILDNTLRSDQSDLSAYVEKISQKRARMVMSSGGLEPVADEGGSGNHSVFASAIISLLQENDGIMDGTLLFSRVRQKVKWNADQTPEYSPIRNAGHDGGDFLFIPNK